MMDRSIAVVMPCFNEQSRLQLSHLRSFAETHHEVRFLFVDDGSTDSTGDLLAKEASTHPRLASVLRLDENVGKAEAVRLGLRQAIREGARLVAYWDADLATPVEELPGMIKVLEAEESVHGVFGSRVRLMGRTIERRPLRHYLGRVFATAASMVLGLPVYDTQCGAKAFRVTRELGMVLDQPFRSKWIFDVELLARFKGVLQADTNSRLREYPLHAWRDIGGSKLTFQDFPRAAIDLFFIWKQLNEGQKKWEGAVDGREGG